MSAEMERTIAHQGSKCKNLQRLPQIRVLCESPEKIAEHASLGHCVAIFSPTLYEDITLGEVNPE